MARKRKYGSKIWLPELGQWAYMEEGVDIKITDPLGNPLTPANPGYVTVPSKVSGEFVRLKVTNGNHKKEI